MWGKVGSCEVSPGTIKHRSVQKYEHVFSGTIRHGHIPSCTVIIYRHVLHKFPSPQYGYGKQGKWQVGKQVSDVGLNESGGRQ